MAEDYEPQPAITISPASVYERERGVTLTVSGSNFTSQSVIRWEGSERPTTYISPEQLQMPLLRSDIARRGTYRIDVVTPGAATTAVATLDVVVGPAGVFEQLTGDSSGGSFSASGFSPDARFVVLTSSAPHVYMLDTCDGGPPACVPSTAQVDRASDGSPADYWSWRGAPDGNGRLVIFMSGATNLGDYYPGRSGIYRRDTCNGGSTGCESSTQALVIPTDPGTFLEYPTITPSGRFVTFSVQRTTGMFPFVTVGETLDSCWGAESPCSPRREVVTVSSAGEPANHDSEGFASSEDGRFIVFSSAASNLVPNDSNGRKDVFVRDTCRVAVTGCIASTTRLSVGDSGQQGNADSDQGEISGDGRFVAFHSSASLLTGDDRSGVFIRDTCSGAAHGCVPSLRLVRENFVSWGWQSRFSSLSVSTDGRYVSFVVTQATGPPPPYPALLPPMHTSLIVMDTCSGAEAPCSISEKTITAGEGDSFLLASISGDGASIILSTLRRLLPDDTDLDIDVYLARTGY